ncbi:Histidine kinase-, DNA gyrase B-, and HSP90-like ATPase [bacterium A37T11]|nr:Histidine kinase-, DNA gyrase B-, and HSP90-like ATPase [bacterium A37T11]
MELLILLLLPEEQDVGAIILQLTGLFGLGAVTFIVLTTQHLFCRQKDQQMDVDLQRQHAVDLQVEGQEVRHFIHIQVAADLHDDIGQVCCMLLGQIKNYQVQSASIRNDTMKTIVQLAHKLYHSLRQFSHALTCDVPARLPCGLLKAMRQHAKAMSEQVGFRIELTIAPGFAPVLNPDHEVLLFRIFQESITNCYKHAQATCLWVQLQPEGDRLCLQISDNGRGFDPRMLVKGISSGLDNIRKRACLLGGSVDICSKPGEGTMITLKIPLS